MKKKLLEKVRDSLNAYLEEIRSSLILSDSDFDKMSDFVVELQSKINDTTTKFIEFYKLKD